MAKKEEKTKKKHLGLKITLLVILIVLTLGIALFVLLRYLIEDKSRNEYVDKGITNEQIIQKEFVNALSSMNENFKFKLSEDDVNQMLTNSLKVESISDYASNAYLDIDGSNFKWCFDLKLPVFTSRLVLSTHIESMGNTYMFLIDSMNIGKLNASNFLQRGEYISDDGFNSLFKNASLPIESDLENNMFIYKPTEFISMFNLGEVTSELFTLVNSPERLSIETDSIGFKLNLEGIRVDSPAETENFDLPNKLENALLEKPFSDLEPGDETKVFEVGESNFSKWIHDWYEKSTVIELVESDLVDTRIDIKIANVSASFKNNQLSLTWTIKINNFYFTVSEALLSAPQDYFTEFKINFFRPHSSNESQIQMVLMDEFIKEGVKKGYLIHDSLTGMITFDFESIFSNDSLSRYMNRADRTIKLENNSLEFIVTRVY